MSAPAQVWDSRAWRAERDARLIKWMAGNRAAADAVVALSTIAETWDDLYDGDKPPSRTRLNEAFVLALVKLQINEFYKANESLFYALILTTINAWMDANELQKSPVASERMLGFGLRNMGQELTMLAVYRAAGWEHLRSVSLEIRRFFSHDSYAEWEHRHA